MASHVFAATVSDLQALLARSHFADTLAAAYQEAFGAAPPAAQVGAWRASLPALARALADGGFGAHTLVLEYGLPFDANRCDAILLGGSGARLDVLVIELKQWTAAQHHHNSDETVVVPALGPHAHPAYQCANYVGKIRNFHSLGNRLRVSGCCFLHNLPGTAPAAAVLADNRFAPLWQPCPLFFADQVPALQGFCRDAVGEQPAAPHLVAEFTAGHYVQSKQFFDGIVLHARDIHDRVTAKVIGSGWGLSLQQLEVKQQVLTALDTGRPMLFLVHGAPGSGKSLLAVHLLLEALSRHKRALLGLVNNRLMHALKHCLDRSVKGASGALKFFTPRAGEGLSTTTQDLDLVICDEGQRMSRKEMESILARAPVLVVFYDPFQRLLPAEQGTEEHFLQVAGARGLNVARFALEANLRCKGGSPYQEWIEQLLSDPRETPNLSSCRWKDRYDFRVFASLADMIGALRQARSRADQDVCLMASFTESDGTNNKIRTHQPLLRWAMSGPEYVDFWVHRGSNRLDTCASVFGCQGFERSFTGIIWGHDYVLRSRRWTLSEAQTITDYIGRPSLLNLVKWGRVPEALDLLYNRYRIMLTRGIDGTYIYCEDAQTREFLLDLAR